MYNLLVTADSTAWDGSQPTYHYSIERFLEQTEPRLRERFNNLDQQAISELCSLPALFAYETDIDKPARIGRVTNIARSSISVALSYQIDLDTAPISRDELLAKQIALGIANPYELRRTHWAVKDVDLPVGISSGARGASPVPERYKTVHVLGEGGQALVRKAIDLELNRPVAIKSLEPFFGIAPDARDRERFRREARALAALAHPSIPAVYDIQLAGSPPQIIFEFIDGTNLLKLLNTRRPTLRETCRWLLQVCSALSHAHDHGIIHRDVKPANLVVRSQTGVCFLVDFGLAAVPWDNLRTMSRTAGTPAYMAPEQVRGEELDARADVYSLAVTLYQLLANKLPAPERYEPLSSMDPDIPPAIDTLIQDCMQPKHIRVATAQQFGRRLRDAASISLSLAEMLEDNTLLQKFEQAIHGNGLTYDSDILREVRAMLERFARVTQLARDGHVTLGDLGIDSGPSIDTVVIPLEEAVKKFKRQYIAEALRKFQGNRTHTARALEVNVRTIFRSLAEDGRDSDVEAD